MRLTTCLFAFVAVLSPLVLSSTPATAQQPATHVACNGNYNHVRISEIKPGMMQTFLDAVAAHQAWYKKAGTPDQISVMRIIDRNPDTKATSYSETQAMTFHIEPADRTQGPPHDAGYDAFVALYKQSSTIKSEYVTCMAK
ncbi:MAG TPA: hypothetical protein VH117_10685 [Edaphobacter sp.]|nr:hypothetical protein [Edaphobacter sp.]